MENGRANSVKKSYSNPRPYQLELLDAAIEENTIVNLGTGAGKTYIAVMLIKELSPPILLPFSEENSKRTIFLVTTVPLVKQQSEYISLHTGLNVGSYTGEMGVDNWPQEKWNGEFEKNQVLVMTMTIFKNLILQNHLSFSKVNLLIFDECHHAVKNHDYVQIMRRFKDFVGSQDATRILGLTASIIPGKCKAEKLEKKIEELECTLCCRSQTARDLQEVARYATNPDESYLFYKSKISDSSVLKLQKIIESPLNFIEQFSKDMKESVFYEIVKMNLEDCLHILLNLGVWCAHQFAVKGLEDITNVIAECKNIYECEWEKALIHLGSTHLEIFIKDSKNILDKGMHKSNKIQRLLIHLGDSVLSSNFLGIIFTERRTTAAFLCKLLQIESERQTDLNGIKCDYVVGHNSKGVTYLRKEAQMNSKEQDKVLNSFRRGKINLLVSTSVVEEGVDVPKCNMVIRFDFPQNFCSYIQSKGRARAKKSKFILLIPEEDKGDLIKQFREYNSLVKELDKICHGRHISDDEAILEHLKDIVKPYQNSFGAMVTINSSLAIVHRYCQKLPKDHYTILAPEFKTEKRPVKEDEYCPCRIPEQDEEFQSSLTLPMSSVIKEPIKGMWFPTKRLADKSAALETVKRLDHEGELNCHLSPISKVVDSSDDEGEDKENPLAGTERRTSLYLNTVAPALTDCFPVSDPGFNCLYMLLVTEASTGNIYLSLNDELEQLSFGILTSKPLPYLQIPEFSIYDDNKELYVKICKYHSTVSLKDQELKILKEAHFSLFNHALKIRPSWLKCTFDLAEKNYLVVPLKVIPAISPMEAYIEFDLAKLLAAITTSRHGNGPIESNSHLRAISWPMSLDGFHNTIVKPNYDPQNNKLYEVKQVNSSITISSPFPGDYYPTYKDYFTEKYNCTFTDPNQPALTCKPLADSSARLQLLISRFKTHGGADIKKSENRGRTVELFPEICDFYLLPANLLKLSYCIPSVLWRMECILAVYPLKQRISAETGIGTLPDGSEVTTLIDFKGYKDLGFGNLKTQKYVSDLQGEQKVENLNYFDPLGPHLRGPDNVLLIQALTTKSANDSIDLERLETLGDSFLKFITSIYLYCDRTSAHEGRLTMARSRRIGNLNLYRLAKQKKITDTIFSSTFDPRQMWIPPCFVFDVNDPYLRRPQQSSSLADQKSSSLADQKSSSLADQKSSSLADQKSDEEKYYLYHRLTDKGVADCVESLIGAYLVSGGIEAGLKFMAWMGIKILSDIDSSVLHEEKIREIKETEEIEEKEMGEIEEKEMGEIEEKEMEEIEEKEMEEFEEKEMEEIEEGEIVEETMSSGESCDSLPLRKRIKISNKLPLFIQNSPDILSRFFKPPSEQQFSEQQKVELKRLLAISMGNNDIQLEIPWKFKDQALLLQAVTHASYTRNRLTDCYQRLEFLGDAVLDYLVTSHIYSLFPNYGPGEISGMRSALVNNNTFAELAVELKLNLALLYNSPSLFNQIELYLKAVTKYESEEADSDEIIVTDDPLCDITNVDDSSDEEVEAIDPPKVLGDILESLAGAIFIDSGMSLESVWEVFQPLFDKKIEKFKGKVPIGPIHQLFQLEPHAKTESKRDCSRGRRWKCTITVLREDGPIQVVAYASKLKNAKAAAAKAILRKIKED